MGNKDTICTYPWHSIYIGPGESEYMLSVCCNAESGAIITNSGARATIKDLPNINELKFMKELRHDLFNGIKNPYCNRCWKMEPVSFRTMHNGYHPDEVSALLLATESPTNTRISDLVLDLGNKCNMACRMCSANASSLIEKELSTGIDVPIALHRGPPRVTNNLLNDSTFIEFIKSNKDELKTIFMFGGEPLINEAHIGFLQLLVDIGAASHVRLQYSTNGTITNIKKFSVLWEKFEAVQIMISIDGYKDAYEYIRWPGTWKQIVDSLNIFKTLSKDLNIICSVSTTMQALTIRSIGDLFRYIETQIEFPLSIIPVDVPEHMSLKVVPTNILIEELSRWREEAPTAYYLQAATSIVQPYIDHPLNINMQKQLYNQFIEISKWQDRYRSQSLFTTHPDILNWFN